MFITRTCTRKVTIKPNINLCLCCLLLSKWSIKSTNYNEMFVFFFKLWIYYLYIFVLINLIDYSPQVYVMFTQTHISSRPPIFGESPYLVDCFCFIFFNRRPFSALVSSCERLPSESADLSNYPPAYICICVEKIWCTSN